MCDGRTDRRTDTPLSATYSLSSIGRASVMESNRTASDRTASNRTQNLAQWQKNIYIFPSLFPLRIHSIRSIARHNSNLSNSVFWHTRVKMILCIRSSHAPTCASFLPFVIQILRHLGKGEGWGILAVEMRSGLWKSIQSNAKFPEKRCT